MLRYGFALIALPCELWAGSTPIVASTVFPDSTHFWIEAQYMAIHPCADGSGFLATNPYTDLATRIHSKGFTVSGPLGSPAWSVDIRLEGVQRPGSTLTPWWSADTPCNKGHELFWTGTGMVLQYLHDAEGLRQNFLLDHAPEGDGGLELVLRFDGDLTASDLDGHGLRFLDPFGEERFTYEGLRVWDACGEVLPATMHIVDACVGRFVIAVQDEGATYPITVDPVATSANRFINGPQANGRFGHSVSSAGDLNGDGYSDVVISAITMSMGENQEGVVFVYYGGPNGIGAVADVILQADVELANFGYSVSHAGDVNGDGFSDLIVGAPNWQSQTNQGNEGGIFIYHGSPTGISTTPDIILQPNSPNKYMGFDVASLGDINGDGYSDIIGGGWLAAYGQSNEGAAWVFLGGPGGLTNDPAHRLERNQAGAQFGFSVAGGGDINGDGYDDVLVGAYRYDMAQTDDGALFVYFGGPGASPLGPGSVAQPLNPEPAQAFNSAGISRRFGWCVASAGDVNGDGYSDVITGDWRDDINGPSQGGTAFVLHGSPSGLSTIPATTVQGTQVNGWLGRRVSSAGDVNGDGYADVLIGEINHTDNLSGQGAAYLHLGSPSGISTTPFFKYKGLGSGSAMGGSLSVAGDVNGDGFSDIILGMQNLLGAAAIYHGGTYLIDVPAAMNAPPPMIVSPGMAMARTGWSVANAGDVNGDGYSDVLIGAPDASNGQAGEGLVHVHYGTQSGIGTTPDLVLEMNIAGAAFGYSVRTAGDVNGDGYADVVVGAPHAGGTGRAYVFLGGPAGLSSMPAQMISGTAGSLFGASVSTAGDINGDGYSDVVIGLPGVGRVRIHLGTPAGLDPAMNIQLNAPQAGSDFGISVATAGDVNGDGLSDVIVGAPALSSGGPGVGAAYVYHGATTGLNPTAALQLVGDQANCRFGISVSSAGDLNGSGYSDVVIGADRWTSGQAAEGAAFVYYGSPGGVLATGSTTLQSNVTGANFGFCVAEAGDVNGDGYADIVIGAPHFNGQLTEQGRVYVFHGRPGGPPPTGDMMNSLTSGSRLGWSVTGGGDFNGDGYSDIIAGAPYDTAPLAEAGSVWAIRGNRASSIDRLTRQYLSDLNSPLSTNSFDNLDTDHFGIGHMARSHMQRKPGRLHWEVVHEGQAFSGTPITTSVFSQGSQAVWSDLGLNGTELKQLLYKQPGFRRYKWRCRVEYPIVRSPDGQRYSRWYYGYASSHGDIGVLPVELLSFEGKAQPEGNRLTWSTASEHGTSRFVVQRGVTNDLFIEIGAVAAAGQSQMLRNYDFLDPRSPLGLSYYRLRIEDADGQVEFTNVVALDRRAGTTILYPNPVVDHLTWISPNIAADQVQVLDGLGRVVINARGTDGQLTERHLHSLSDGTYTLLLLDGTGAIIDRLRFVKAQAPMVR